MAIGEGIREVPDSEDELLSSSPAEAFGVAADKLLASAHVPHQGAQDTLQRAVSHHQENAENAANAAVEPFKALGADHENASFDVEPLHAELSAPKLNSHSQRVDNSPCTSIDVGKVQTSDEIPRQELHTLLPTHEHYEVSMEAREGQQPEDGSCCLGNTSISAALPCEHHADANMANLQVSGRNEQQHTVTSNGANARDIALESPEHRASILSLLNTLKSEKTTENANRSVGSTFDAKAREALEKSNDSSLPPSLTTSISREQSRMTEVASINPLGAPQVTYYTLETNFPCTTTPEHPNHASLDQNEEAHGRNVAVTSLHSHLARENTDTGSQANHLNEVDALQTSKASSYSNDARHETSRSSSGAESSGAAFTFPALKSVSPSPSERRAMPNEAMAEGLSFSNDPENVTTVELKKDGFQLLPDTNFVHSESHHDTVRAQLVKAGLPSSTEAITTNESSEAPLHHELLTKCNKETSLPGDKNLIAPSAKPKLELARQPTPSMPPEKSRSSTIELPSALLSQKAKPKSQQEITLAELRAQKAALLISLASLPAIQVLIEEHASSEVNSADDTDEPTETEIAAAANKIVKEHIKLLHEYNELKDVGQGLMGLIADQRGVRIVEVQEEFGIDAND